MQVNNKIFDGNLLNQRTNEQTSIKLSVISHLLLSSYLIHIYKDNVEINIYIIYQITPENVFRLVCNLGSLFAEVDQEYTIYIPKWDLPFNESYNMTNIFSPTFTTFTTHDVRSFSIDFFEHYIRDAENIEVLEKSPPTCRLMSQTFLYLSAFYRDISNRSSILYNSRLSTANYHFLIKPSTLEQQIYFMTRIPSRLQVALRLYSHNGDILLNSYLRNKRQISEPMQIYYNTHQVSFQNYWKKIGTSDQENLQRLLEEFDSDMQQLFYSAPPLTQNMKVYRGVTQIDYFKDTFLNLYRNVGYISTSFNPNVALIFSEDKYMSIIYLKEGTRVLYNIYSEHINEKEIILPNGSYFLITKEFQPHAYVWDTMTVETNECILLTD